MAAESAEADILAAAKADPAELTAWLDAYRAREHVGRMTLVVSPLVYNTMPEVMRVRGHSHYDWPTFLAERPAIPDMRDAALNLGVNLVYYAFTQWDDQISKRRKGSLSPF